jgi:hypothetical protein
MEPTELNEKTKFNWQRSLITVGIVIVTAGIIGGTTWYVMNQQATKDKETANKTAQDLQKQIDDLKKTQTTTSTTTTTTTPATTTPATTTLTNDQIYQEVANQLGLTRSGLTYFRIWGQDKVQY